MSQDSKQVSKKGCLIFAAIALAAIGMLMIYSKNALKERQADWDSKKESLVTVLDAAEKSGDYANMISITKDYAGVEEADVYNKKAQEMKRVAEEKAEATRLAKMAPIDRFKEALTLESDIKERVTIVSVKGTPLVGHMQYNAKDSFNRVEQADQAFEDVDPLINKVFKDSEILELKLEVMIDGMDSYGKKGLMPWITIKLKRSEWEKADWEALSKAGRIRKFLEEKGSVDFSS